MARTAIMTYHDVMDLNRKFDHFQGFNFDNIYQENYHELERIPLWQFEDIYSNKKNRQTCVAADADLDLDSIDSRDYSINDFKPKELAESYVYPGYNATVGFLNGTRLYGGSASVTCQTTINSYIDLITYEIYNDIINIMIYDAIYDITDLFTLTYTF